MITDYEIRNRIIRFADSIQNIIGDKLMSVYLYGSVTLQDYKDGWSDIDLICFTSERISSSEAEQLLMLRQTLSEAENDSLFRKIEGSVVCLDEFESNCYSSLIYWGTSGQRITDSYSLDVFSMYELIKYGELVFGTDIRQNFTLPSYNELCKGVKQHYETIRKYAKKTNESIYSCGWLLDIARCLYTLKNGDIISKTAAGVWALDKNLCPCVNDMEKTLAIRNNPSEYIDLPETKKWLSALGLSIQLFADVLEKELISS